MSANANGSPRSARAWLLLAFGPSRQYAGNLGYEDDPSRVYRYDSFVPNHRQLASGDVAVLQGPGGVIGYARIERIDSWDETKKRQRCPDCRTTALKARKTKRPVYRCDDAHEFDQPLSETVVCTQYAAHFGDSFTAATRPIDPLVLRRACTPYNGQHAMQPLDPDRLDEETAGSARRLIRQFLGTEIVYLAASDAVLSEVESGRFSYEPPTHDSRELVMQQIRARRGQKAFRQALRDRYGDRCLATGCELVDILEAAHISPYRGRGDQHPENGLLLRADLHTLFDLDLMGVEPETLILRFHPAAISAGYAAFDGCVLRCTGVRPSRAALESRWAAFQRRLREA